MCDSLAEGGRRCPCTSSTYRSAYRKSAAAATRAPEGGIGSGGTPTPAAADSPWDAARAQQVADDITAATSGVVYTRRPGVPYSEDDFAFAERAGISIPDEDVQATRAARRLYDTYGGVEQATVAVGTMIADEAERRTGITVTQISDLQRDEVVRAQMARAQAEADEGPAAKAYQEDPQCQEYEGFKRDLVRQGFAALMENKPRLDGMLADLQANPAFVERERTREAAFQARQGLERATAGRFPEMEERLASLSTAYTQVLSETRPIGGTQTQWHQDSDARITQTMDQAAQTVFPADWIDAHNDGTPVLAHDADAAGVRPYYWHPPAGSAQQARILGSPRDNDAVVDRGVEGGYRVAIHEMTHRMEAIVPGVKDLERDFLRRRTTREDGSREPLVALYGGERADTGEQEWARPDSFVSAYIGKEYDSGHTEVLSMGTESLFAGANGGLVGAGQHQADPDMRAFVLGVYASAGRTKEKG